MVITSPTIRMLLMNIPNHRLIEFANLLNEVCAVVGSENATDWLDAPHKNLDDESPMNYFYDSKTEKVYDLLRFIEIDEADIC